MAYEWSRVPNLETKELVERVGPVNEVTRNPHIDAARATIKARLPPRAVELMEEAISRHNHDVTDGLMARDYVECTDPDYGLEQSDGFYGDFGQVSGEAPMLCEVN